MDAIRFVTTPLEATHAVATLDIKSLLTIEPVLVSININYCTNDYATLTTSIHADIDECALGISGCNQICNNTIGSYTCSCYLGYQIALDNRTCLGEH